MGVRAIAEEKRTLRQRLKAERAAIPDKERALLDASIMARLTSTDTWHEAGVVFTYLSFGAEVSTRELIEKGWEEGKRVVLPRCVPGTRDMRWFAVDSFEGLERSSFGVDEPAIDPEREVSPAEGGIAVVPGLAFDTVGRRIGYGGGYYDVYLSSFCGIAVGVCREAFVDRMGVLARLEEPHDRRVEFLATESGVFPVTD